MLDNSVQKKPSRVTLLTVTNRRQETSHKSYTVTMHNWHLLLFALLAAIQPIASFIERNLVDGQQECGDRQPHILLRNSRLLHGSRHSKNIPDDHLDKRETFQEERQYEVKKPIHSRHSSDTLLLGIRETNTRYLKRYSRSENSLEVHNENRERFSSVGDVLKGSDTKDDIDPKLSRGRVTREHGRDNFESRMSRDDRRIRRLEYDQYSRMSRDSRRETRPIQDNSRETRRFLSTHDLERDMNDGTRTEFSNNKNNKDLSREQYAERRQSLIHSELRSQIGNNRNHRSPDRRIRERNDISRRSLSLDARANRLSNLREDAREKIPRDILEGHELIHVRTNERSGITRQQRHVSRMVRVRTISVRSSDQRQQERDELSSVTRTSDKRSSFLLNRIRESLDRSRIVNSRNRQEIRDLETQPKSVISEEKERFLNNQVERTDKRRAQESSHFVKEHFTRNRRRVDKKPLGFGKENERDSKIHQGISIEERSLRTSHENGDRLAITQKYFRRAERLSAAASREQNEQLSKNIQDFRYEDTTQDNRQNIHGVERRTSIIRDTEIRRSLSRQTRNSESRVLSATRKENDRFSRYQYEITNHERKSLMASQEELTSNPQVEIYNERFLRKANRMESERFSRNRRVRSNERDSQVDSREQTIDRQEIANNERYSRRTKHASVVDRSKSTNFRENLMSRSVVTNDRDISRTRNLMNRGLVSGLRKPQLARNAEIRHNNLTIMQSEQLRFDMNWQIILYTLQAIYLCSFIMQMVTDNKKNTTKSRSLSWFSLPSQNLFKLE